MQRNWLQTRKKLQPQPIKKSKQGSENFYSVKEEKWINEPIDYDD